MGSGKTVVSQELQRQLNCGYVDLDQLIESKHGKIADIFSQSGEDRFRELEFGFFEHALLLPVKIISTGGGLVMHAPSLARLKSLGQVVWLRATYETVLKRIENDRENLRPLADQQLHARYNMRQPLYESVANQVIDVDHLSIEEVAEKIINRYR